MKPNSSRSIDLHREINCTYLNLALLTWESPVWSKRKCQIPTDKIKYILDPISRLKCDMKNQIANSQSNCNHEIIRYWISGYVDNHPTSSGTLRIIGNPFVAYCRQETSRKQIARNNLIENILREILSKMASSK